MVKRCCMPRCHVEWAPGKEVTFHRFPKENKDLEKWYDAFPQGPFQRLRIDQYSVICSRHFTQEDFILCGSGRRQLRKGAVPTIFEFSKLARKAKLGQSE